MAVWSLGLGDYWACPLTCCGTCASFTEWGPAPLSPRQVVWSMPNFGWFDDNFGLRPLASKNITSFSSTSKSVLVVLSMRSYLSVVIELRGQRYSLAFLVSPWLLLVISVHLSAFWRPSKWLILLFLVQKYMYPDYFSSLQKNFPMYPMTLVFLCDKQFRGLRWWSVRKAFSKCSWLWLWSCLQCFQQWSLNCY